MTCPFCARMPLNDAPVAVLDDAFPLASGHKLIVPKRHVARFADLDDAELGAIAGHVRLLTGGEADGYTVGINDGSVAGQTVPHLHVHVIPRTPGDVADPRGGVRWVIPDKAAYWDASQPRPTYASVTETDASAPSRPDGGVG